MVHIFKVSDSIFFFEIDRNSQHQTLTSYDLDESDVTEAISSLSLNSAPGPESLQANILKSCVDELGVLFYRFLTDISLLEFQVVVALCVQFLADYLKVHGLGHYYS